MIEELEWFRCRGCGRRLMRARLIPGSVAEIKCRCGCLNLFVAVNLQGGWQVTSLEVEGVDVCAQTMAEVRSRA